MATESAASSSESAAAPTTTTSTAASPTTVFVPPVVSDATQAQVIVDQLQARGDPILESLEGWAEIDHGEKSLPTLKMWQKMLPGSSFLAVKTAYTFDVSVDKMLQFLWDADFETRKQLSPELEAYRVVEELSPTLRVIQMKMSLPWPMSSRESLLITSHKRSGPNAAYYGCSCEHASVPATPGFLRAITLLLACTLQSVEENKTLVTTVGHADPKGWIPAWLINFMIKKQSAQVKKMKEVLATWDPKH
ncbi:hypothetical protein Pelo_1103 [Pelomyxa schiedti]|nr:hypothetical protein Pelo_1103 [Pelomyxa schiedti]